MSQIQLKFYNSRTKQIDIFSHDKSIPINMYTCGPTVYSYSHIGNLKTFLWSDFVVQYLNAIGYKTNHIMNITDIDDKIISRLPEQTYSSLIEYTSFYTDKFLEDIGKLGIRNYTKENIHKVTDNVDSMEQMVLDLIEKGFAYETPDGSIYFDSTKIPESNPFYVQNDTEGYESSRNIIRAEGVRNHRDFVLWKVKTDRTIVWGKKLTPGTFGWDSECCALCDKILGKVHIKCGGFDLKSKHHSNEISQAESLHPDRIYGDYWIHFGFLNFGGDKMSKSLGNVLRLDDVVFNHYLIRMYLLTKSYKNDVDYIDEEILLLKKDFINFHMLYNKLSNKFYRSHKNDKLNYSGQIEIYTQILEIISNNLNVFDAIREFIKYVDKLMKVYLTSDYADKILDELNKVNNLLNILDKSLLLIDSDTMNLIEEREELRKLKYFDKTDAIREQIKLTYIFEDENTGFTLIKKF